MATKKKPTGKPKPNEKQKPAPKPKPKPKKKPSPGELDQPDESKPRNSSSKYTIIIDSPLVKGDKLPALTVNNGQLVMVLAVDPDQHIGDKRETTGDPTQPDEVKLTISILP